MARITPSSGGALDLEQLRDFEPYLVSLHKFDWTTSAPQYGNEPRLELDWQLEDGSGAILKDWVNLRLARQSNGQVAKFRAMLNAIAEQPEQTEIAWFETDTLEWSYDGETPYAKLDTDYQVVVRGRVEQRQDGSERFRITNYQAASSVLNPQPAPQPSAAVRTSPNPAVQQGRVQPTAPAQQPRRRSYAVQPQRQSQPRTTPTPQGQPVRRNTANLQAGQVEPNNAPNFPNPDDEDIPF